MPAATIRGMPELREGWDVEEAVGETGWVMAHLADHYVSAPPDADAYPLAGDERWDEPLIEGAFKDAVDRACSAVSLRWDRNRGVIIYPESMTAAKAAVLWNAALAEARHHRLGEIVAQTRAGRGDRLADRTRGSEWVLPN